MTPMFHLSVRWPMGVRASKWFLEGVVSGEFVSLYFDTPREARAHARKHGWEIVRVPSASVVLNLEELTDDL